MSAGERTWRIYRRKLGKWRQAFAKMEAVLGVTGPDMDGWVEVVELSRLRAAEEERDRTMRLVALLLDEVGGGEFEHIVEVREDGFTTQHPLRERLDGSLFGCEVDRRLRELDGPPRKPGRYRVTEHQPDAYSEAYRPGDAGFDFEALASLPKDAA